MKNNKKGFTIVELVIVIAVIAILASVLIPVFTSLIDKAEESSDTRLVRNLNTALACDVLEKHTTVQSALDCVENAGYVVERINATNQENEILWDSENDVFCYLVEGKVKYIPETKLIVKDVAPINFWRIAKDIDNVHSTYYLGDKKQIETNAGINCMRCKDVESVTYKNEESVTASIFTNGGTLTVDTEGTVDHYGYSDKVIVEKASSNDSYHEFGTVADTYVNEGHYVAETGCVVYYFESVSETKATLNAGSKVLNVKSGSKLENNSAETPAIVEEKPNCNGGHDFGSPVEESGVRYHTCNRCGFREEITGNTTKVSSQSSFEEAVLSAEDGDTIQLLPSETAYTLPSSIASKKLVIEGTSAEEVKINRNTAQGLPGLEITLKNVTLVGQTSGYVGYQHTTKEVYDNCVFKELTFFYAETVILNGCTFNQANYEYCFWTYGAKHITFNSCTFNTQGKAAKVYNEATEGEFNVAFNDCVFNTANDTKNKPAIAVNSLGAKFNITISNCTAPDFANGETIEDDAMTAWYTNRMAEAPAEDRKLIGCEGQLDEIAVTINGKNY